MRSIAPDLARKALEAAPDATIIIDDAGIIRFANRQVMAMFGHSYEDIIDRSIEQLLPERFRSRHVMHRQSYGENVRMRPMGPGLDLFALRKDGTEFQVEISLSPVEDGDRTLVAASIRDVTERRRMEVELRHLQSIADTALSSESTGTLIRALLARLRAALHTDTTTILLADTDGRHLTPFASDGIEGEVGGEIQIPIGQGVAGRIALSEGPMIFKDLREAEVVSPVLRSRVRSLIGTPLRSAGHLVGVVHAGSLEPRCFSADDSRLLALAADRIGLAIERARLNEAEHAARQAAEAADRQKSRFLATASHDLRQPLQTLSLLNGALRRIIPDGEAAQALSHQEAAISVMSRLLNTLLDISKLESGMIKPEPHGFPVAGLLAEMRNEFESVAAAKGLRLEVEPSTANAYSDRSLLGQIIRNLLSNAIKYTREGRVQVRCLAEADQLRIEVSDTGAGIAADQLPYIYEEFYQVGVPSNATRDGYGLGLSIVARLVKLLALRLEVKSELGRGSTFSLCLPAANHSVMSVAPSAATAQGQTVGKQRVLLVEDDASVRMATSMLLRVEGYEVTAVATVGEALARLNDGFELLVTDYHLDNGETGLQLINVMRERLGPVPLKCVLITGDTSATIKDAPKDNFLKIASKPINANELLMLLRTLIAA